MTTGRRAGLVLAAVLVSREAAAAPPYTTDDPEPVPYRHWELYLASETAKGEHGFAATSPHVEVNYGALRDLQLHVLAPMVLAVPNEGPQHYGYGDTELGAKWRFVHEGRYTPEIGTYTLVELPTGSRPRSLGGGYLEAFVPLLFQKRFGEWTTYGGAGFWFHPGPGNRNWLQLGWQLQRRFGAYGSLGVEAFYRSPEIDGAQRQVGFNVGSTLDLSEMHHILVSVGRALAGPNKLQSYVAYLVTFGPK